MRSNNSVHPIGNTEDDMVPNPFYFKLKVPWYRYPQIALMSVTVVPIRLILIGLVNTLGWAIAFCTLWGTDIDKNNTEPFTGTKKKVLNLLHMMGRNVLRIHGFHRVKVIGTPASPEEAPGLVAAPHSSYFDALAIFSHVECPHIVSKYEALSYPLMGKLLRMTQPVLVQRDHATSKNAVIKELCRRADSPKWGQYIIFPEATTTNRKALCMFKVGAFIPGKPVQPVLLKYTDSWDTVTWTWTGANGFVSYWLSLCKLWQSFELTYLPVYTPNQEEVNDPALYAENVRQVMAEAYKVSCVDLNFDHARKMVKSGEVKIESFTKRKLDEVKSLVS